MSKCPPTLLLFSGDMLKKDILTQCRIGGFVELAATHSLQTLQRCAVARGLKAHTLNENAARDSSFSIETSIDK